MKSFPSSLLILIGVFLVVACNQGSIIQNNQTPSEVTLTPDASLTSTVVTPKRPSPGTPTSSPTSIVSPSPEATLIPYTTPAWFGEAIVYEIFVRSFADSDGDGVGDLNGVTDLLPGGCLRVEDLGHA